MLRKSAAARIVNVSSGLGSLTLNGDLAWQHVGVKFLAYSASKAALNMFTVQLAYELRDTGIKVNSADPGYTKTDLNHNAAPRPSNKVRPKPSASPCCRTTAPPAPSPPTKAPTPGKHRVSRQVSYTPADLPHDAAHQCKW